MILWRIAVYWSVLDAEVLKGSRRAPRLRARIFEPASTTVQGS
ncbi:hypothetical protein [Mycobacteroides abscessus]|nr:hypothetical protein [Mycobacteroides abscessus]